MSFLYIHLVQICHSFTFIWSGYVIPPHPDISGPDGCGGMIYSDEMDVEE
jgi:hypothetical protein